MNANESSKPVAPFAENYQKLLNIHTKIKKVIIGPGRSDTRF